MAAPDWTPEFEGQRPPFAPGNQVAVKHGAHSSVALAPRVASLKRSLLASMKLRQSDLDWVARELLDAYCRSRSKVIAIDEWLEHEPLVRPDGTAPDVVRVYLSALNSSVKTLDALRSTIAEAARNDARFIDAVDALAAGDAQ